jgi:hypothetical protein
MIGTVAALQDTVMTEGAKTIAQTGTEAQTAMTEETGGETMIVSAEVIVIGVTMSVARDMTAVTDGPIGVATATTDLPAGVTTMQWLLMDLHEETMVAGNVVEVEAAAEAEVKSAVAKMAWVRLSAEVPPPQMQSLCR